ncbi:hypothetical protein NLI96_g3124 [Meripilus lineatus]|uniref:DUF6533 domain-containing protein n=1 Tax=Meripilus lineatus TaxID=2056292 RepID=A0AAD5V7E5_9APHY|nr:hypothetical protein NLI96_g3124 [Physisporinus lineatus]
MKKIDTIHIEYQHRVETRFDFESILERVGNLRLRDIPRRGTTFIPWRILEACSISPCKIFRPSEGLGNSIMDFHRIIHLTAGCMYLKVYQLETHRFTPSSIAILYYDWMLTLDDEIHYLWNTPTYFTLLLLANRYFTFFTFIPILSLEIVLRGNAGGCHIYSKLQQVQAIINGVIVFSILIVRTYALYNRSKKVLIFLCVSLALIVGVSTWALPRGKIPQPNIDNGCQTLVPESASIRSAISWEAPMVFDLIIFGLTLYKIIEEKRGSHVSLNELTRLMFRDGAVFFAIMALANSANVLTYYILTPSLKGAIGSVSTHISVVLVSRAMLNIRKYGSSGERQERMMRALGLQNSLQYTSVNLELDARSVRIEGLHRDQSSVFRAWERLLHFARVFSHDLRPSFTSTSSKANRFWSPSPYRIHDVKPSRRRRPIPLKLLKLEVSYILGLVLTVCLCDCHIIFGRCVNGNWSSAKFGFTGIVFTSNTRSSAAVGTL